MLSEGLADALCRPAMDLAFEGEGVDDCADIVDDDIAQHSGGTGLGIDLDLADMAAVSRLRAQCLHLVSRFVRREQE
jgi:hypothetical protein